MSDDESEASRHAQVHEVIMTLDEDYGIKPDFLMLLPGLQEPDELKEIKSIEDVLIRLYHATDNGPVNICLAINDPELVDAFSDQIARAMIMRSYLDKSKSVQKNKILGIVDSITLQANFAKNFRMFATKEKNTYRRAILTAMVEFSEHYKKEKELNETLSSMKGLSLSANKETSTGKATPKVDFPRSAPPDFVQSDKDLPDASTLGAPSPRSNAPAATGESRPPIITSMVPKRATTTKIQKRAPLPSTVRFNELNDYVDFKQDLAEHMDQQQIGYLLEPEFMVLYGTHSEDAIELYVDAYGELLLPYSKQQVSADVKILFGYLNRALRSGVASHVVEPHQKTRNASTAPC
jgi:hypothetical protein